MLACCALVLVAPVAAAGATPAAATVTPGGRYRAPAFAGQAAPPPSAAEAPPLAAADIVVDADTGQVLDSYDDRQPLRVASLAKILTALVVRAHVPLGTPVPISARAAGVPALKINAKAGQVWNSTDLLWCLLLPSANDAAVALAEKAGGGNLDGFVVQMNDEAASLRLADHPLLHDPAGLDGTQSFDGGDFVSARDLAIATRAFLADPVLAGIVDQHEYRFAGGDGVDHRIVGHNQFLTTYPGAIGVKTGYTEASGHSLVAAAQRDGRTLIAVVIDSPNPDAVAAALLDRAFAGPPPAAAGSDRLPARPSDTTLAARPKAAAAMQGAVVASPTGAPGGPSASWLAVLAAAAALCLALGLLLRRTSAFHRGGMRRLEGPSRRRHPSGPHRWDSGDRSSRRDRQHR